MLRKLTPVVGLVVFVFLVCTHFSGSLMPPVFLDRVVAIGRIETSPGPMQGQWVAEASGFLYGDFLSKVDETHNSYQVYLITNKHVIDDHASATNGAPMFVKFNLRSEGAAARPFPVPLVGQDAKPTWHAHPNPTVDLVIVPINPDVLEKQGARFDYFQSDSEVLSRTKAKEVGLSEGDGIFVLGFPMGLVGQQREYVIVRQGTIARVRDTLDSPGTSSSFLIDSFIFPGSSGGPVVLKPEVASVRGTNPIQRAYLLGIVKGYLPYTDMAISLQTKRPRVTFEENSGLAEVIPADYIIEAIQAYKNSAAPTPAVPH